MKRVLTFIVLTALFSAIFWWPARSVGFGLYTTLLMFSPAAAALATVRTFGQPLASLGWRGSNWRYLFAGWAIPLGSVAAISIAGVLLGAATFPSTDQLAERASKMGTAGASPTLSIALLALLSCTAGIVNMCATAVGEEIGWRGFLTPALAERSGWIVASLITGIVWALWHFPLFVGLQSAIGLMAFTATVIALAFILSWLRAASESIWPAVVAHGTHNAVLSQFWDRLLVAPDNTVWVGEASFSLAIAYALVAAALWLRWPGVGRKR